MERSLGKLRNNKCLYFSEFIVSALEVGIQGQHGFTCSVGFMGRRCQMSLEDLTSRGILSACIPWCCCAWRRMEVGIGCSAVLDTVEGLFA